MPRDRSAWRRAAPAAGAIVLGTLLALTAPSGAQQVYRNSFESHQTSWAKGSADVEYAETAHAVTEQGSRDGQRSEYVELTAKQGSHIYYQMPTRKAPVSDEL